MNTENYTLQPWEEAFVAVSHDVMVGKLFKGIVHNLNGVLQAFSMQGELLSMMFQQANGLLDSLEECIPTEKQEAFAKLRMLISQRAIIVRQMEEKVALSLDIMHNTMALRESGKGQASSSKDVNVIIKNETEFLSGDMFFKHKIEKHFNLTLELPEFNGNTMAVHYSVHALLVNASEAMAEVQEPQLIITTRKAGQGVEILVEDTGPGISKENQERIFEPFFTTRPGHIGVGLYLAKKLLLAAGGRISVESGDGRTCFTIFCPC